MEIVTLYLWMFLYGFLLVCLLSIGVSIPSLAGLAFIILPLILTILVVQCRSQWKDAFKIAIGGFLISCIISLIPFMIISNSLTPREEFIPGTQTGEVALIWAQFFVTQIPLTIVGMALGLLVRQLREILWSQGKGKGVDTDFTSESTTGIDVGKAEDVRLQLLGLNIWKIFFAGMIFLFIGFGISFYSEAGVYFSGYGVFRTYPHQGLGLILVGLGGTLLMLIHTKLVDLLKHVGVVTVCCIFTLVFDQLSFKLVSNTLYGAMVFCVFGVFTVESGLYFRKSFSEDGDAYDSAIGFLLIGSGFVLLFNKLIFLHLHSS